MTITKNITYNILSQLPQVFAMVFVSILSTRILGPEGKGVFGLITYNILFAGLILNLGVHIASTYFIASKQTTPAKVLGLSIYQQLVNTSLLAIFLLSLYFSSHSDLVIPTDQSVKLILFYIIAAFGLGQMANFIKSIFQGKKRFKFINRSLLLKAISNIALFGGLYAFHLFSPVEIEAVILVSFAVTFINFCYWVISYIMEFGEKPDLSSGVFDQIKLLFSFSLLGYFSALLNFLNYRLDIFVVQHYNTIDQVGYYILAVNLTQMLWLISDPIAGVLKPFLSDPKWHSKREAYFGACLRLNGTVIASLSLLGWLLAETIIPIVYGNEFDPAIQPFRILLLGNFFACSSKVFGVFNYVTNNIKFNVYSTLFGVIMTLIFDLLLIPKYGIAGAAWASNIAYVSIFVFLLIAARVKFGLTIRNPFLFTMTDYRMLRNE